MKNKSITDILLEVEKDICDNYCKYRETSDVNGECELIRAGKECPLWRL